MITDLDDEAFWREMTRMPDLQKLVERTGRRLAARLREQYDPKRHPGYPQITPDEWVKWDTANAEFQEQRRRLMLQAELEKISVIILSPEQMTLEQIQTELRAVSGTPSRFEGDTLRRQQLWRRLDQLVAGDIDGSPTNGTKE